MAANKVQRISGSFRDPSGHVFSFDNSILRTVNPKAAKNYEAIRSNATVKLLRQRGDLIDFDEVRVNEWPEQARGASYLLRHPKIPYISYPYEWSFSQLKAAALLHLSIQLLLLKDNFVLSDASAYNVQFIGSKPIFIDVLSIRNYKEGEYWNAHRQFCEQFLNPLLLRSLLGVSHNSWFRGALEGIPTSDLAKLIPGRKKLSLKLLMHVLMQARLEQNAIRNPDMAVAGIKSGRKLNKAGYQGLLQQMRNWISRLEPAGSKTTIWGQYASANTYSDDESQAKRQIIGEFAQKTTPGILVDVGCNSGDFSVAAIEGGASYIVGFDFDQTALEVAFERATREALPYLPLWLDASNPSPSQGWLQSEREGFDKRTRADAMIALAFEHHLAIAKNVPLDQVISWLTDIAPRGIIEFVPKDDPTVRKMLSLREDIFPSYTLDEFANQLGKVGRIVDRKIISSSGRTLFFYSKL